VPVAANEPANEGGEDRLAVAGAAVAMGPVRPRRRRASAPTPVAAIQTARGTMPSEEEGRSPGIGANWWAVESAVESAVERAVERAVDRANTASLEPRDPPSGELS
jgi:hypothetical protein